MDKELFLKKQFAGTFGYEPQLYCEAPGRTELGGNHTDHQRGKVLAAAVDLKTRAVFSERKDRKICLFSEGYGKMEIDADRIAAPEKSEYYTAASLVKGIAHRLRQLGHEAGGFDAYIMSEVLSGSGLSSSAAFEVLICRLFLMLEGKTEDPLTVAKIGQYAENEWFGKPSGLMDQAASSIGGVIAVDFRETDAPEVEKISYDFKSSGYHLYVIDSGADHADLTEEYAAVTREIGGVCRHLGAGCLREVPEEMFYDNIKALRQNFGDRAVLRCIHVFDENRRVELMKEALCRDDFERYLELVRESGRSSLSLLQNVTPSGASRHQELLFAIAFAEKAAGEDSAVRVHGGGFAGTCQAYVPDGKARDFEKRISDVLGENALKKLCIQDQRTGSCV